MQPRENIAQMRHLLKIVVPIFLFPPTPNKNNVKEGKRERTGFFPSLNLKKRTAF